MKHKLHKLMAMFIASIFAVSAFAQTDVTSQYLQNTDFEQASPQNGNTINTPPGWTLKHETSGWLDGSTRASTNPGGDGSQCYNLWAGTVSLADIYQTVTLPAGKYKLTVGLYSDGDAERYAYATVGGNTIKSANAKVGSWDFVSVEFSNPTEGEVTMGAVSKGWFQIDNVTLEYLGEVTKDDFINAYNQALSEAQALVDQKMSAVAAAQLEATIAAYGSLTADNSIEELEAATEAILAEIEPVKASVNSYKVLAAGVLPDNSLEGWTCTNSNTFQINTWSGEGNSDGTNMVTPFIQNWVGKESLLGNGKISYTLPGVNPGYYKVSSLIRVYSEANNDIAGASFFANEVKTDFATGKPFTYNNMKGIYDVYTAVVNVGEEGTLEFGVEIENATFNWVAFKNVKIEYIGVIDQAAAEALKAKIPTTKYDAALTAEVEALVAAIDAGVTFENYLALSEKVALAETSAAAYAANKTAIDGMFSLMESTNVYTAEAFAAYSAKAEDFLAQYEAGTLTATVDNPLSIHGWHATVEYDDFMLSAFGVKDFDDALHINTWSTEGETDGSEFKVPFFEYWTGDGESLGVATKTATVAGLTPGAAYNVEAWVRVRAKNGVAPADATGITLSVGEGEAVDVTEGAVIGESQFAHAVYTATGSADAEGNLVINFNILDGNNISWLAFKNLKYTAIVEEEPAAPKYYTIASYNRGGVLTDVNGAAQHVAVNENSYWYFVEANDNGGVNICNVNGRSLNHDLTIGETETPAVWYILPNGVNDKGQSISKTNPISSGSCVDANNYNAGVGTWHPSASDWEGTTWVIVEVDYLKDIEALIEANKDNHAEKPALGQYTTAAYEALVAAKETVKNPMDAIKAVKAFKGAKNLPMFTINGVISYAAGKSIYDDPGNVNAKGNSHYFKTTDATDMAMLWALDMTETEVSVVESVGIHNVGTGANFWGCPTIKITETEENEGAGIADDGIFLFYTTDNNNPIHAQNDGQLVCRYGDKGAASGSAWTFTYVGNTYDLAAPEVDENDYTSCIVNADLATEEGWDATGTKGISGGMVKVGSGATFNFCQTISLPAGQYKMTAKAAYRYGADEQAEYDAIEAGDETHLVKLYAETATYKYEANVQNRNEGASETDYAAGEGSVTVNNLFVPNSSNAVKAWFDADQYVNVLVFNVQEDGEIKIGIANVGNNPGGDYTNIGAWTLTRLGDAEADPEELSIVSATAGDVAIVEGKATVESISSFEITFDRPVVKVEDAEWAQLTDQWGDNSLKAEVLEDNNCVVRFSLQWDVFTEAGDYYLYIPEGVVADAEDANCVNAAIEAVITIEGGSVTPGASLNVTNVTVGEDVMADLSAISATPADMIKINFDGKFYFQGSPVIVDAEGNEAPMAFEYMNGLDVDGSNSYILMGKEAGVYTITLAKDQFNELEMMGWKAPAEDIVLKVQIIVENDPTGIESVESQNEAVIYDLSGRRVQTMTKGLYIVNGRKVIVK